MKKCLLALLLLFTVPTLAANTTGYAWSESVGWFDFSKTTVTNESLTGYAYNDNTGWLMMDGVVNQNGNLSGYAWSESVGYFDFNNVSISNGNFTGQAYNDNTGWLSFSTGTNVTTMWAPVTTTPAPTQSAGGAYYGGGSSIDKRYLPTVLSTQTCKPDSGIITSLSNNKRNFGLRSTGNDVKLLQQFLNCSGFTVSNSGVGSAGNETMYFGNLTKQALSRFQAANNIKPSTGYFGPLTKAFIKNIKN